MKVFYNPQMSTPSHGYSPSGSKPAAAVADWQARGLDIEIVDFEPLTEADLCLAHDKKFVRRVLTGKEANGHGNTRKEVTQSCLWTGGSLVAAARAALIDGITCSPSSGFHHSRVAGASAYCTFNSLVIAARKMIGEGRVEKVGIVDCDAHYFDGVVDIIDTLELHDAVKGWSFGEEFGSRHVFRMDELLQELGESLTGMKADGVELILYQAGADPYENDPLSGSCGMTIEELRIRDRFVFETSISLGIPVCWVFAGGYARDKDGGISEVLEIHRNTALEAIAVLNNRERKMESSD